MQRKKLNALLAVIVPFKQKQKTNLKMSLFRQNKLNKQYKIIRSESNTYYIDSSWVHNQTWKNKNEPLEKYKIIKKRKFSNKIMYEFITLGNVA